MGIWKLRRKDTIFLRSNQEHMPYPQGVFLDVFPVDNVPDDYFSRMLINLKLLYIENFYGQR